VQARRVRPFSDALETFSELDVGDKQTALVDCGNDASAEAVPAEISKAQPGADAVTAICLTHGSAARRSASGRTQRPERALSAPNGPLVRTAPIPLFT